MGGTGPPAPPLATALLIQIDFQFLKKLWCSIGGRDENKNLVLSNKLIKVELPPAVP